MQIQFDDIGGGERLLWQFREEEFVDHARTCGANRAFLFASRMGRYHHAARHALGSHRHVGTVVEAAHHLAFRALLELIWWEMQTCLDARMIKDRVVFATNHEGEASQIREHRSCPILSIKSQQSALFGQLMRCEVAFDGSDPPAQSAPISSIASVAKGAEPLEAVGLTDHCARPHDLPTFAPPVTRGTDLIQPAKSRWQVFSLG